MGKLFKKPSYKAPTPAAAPAAAPAPVKAPTPAAAPAPVVEEATQKPKEDSSRKKKKQGKASLMVDSTNSAIGSGGTGINL